MSDTKPIAIALEVFLRSPFNYDTHQVSAETALTCPPEEDRTQQQFASEVDINTIVKRFGLTGELPIHDRPPMVGDFTEVHDYQSALNAVIAAKQGFEALPATVRRRFSNNPQMALEFLEDPSNRDEAERLGLVNPPVQDGVSTVPAVVKTPPP